MINSSGPPFVKKDKFNMQMNPELTTPSLLVAVAYA
jgi:hypothetical protein